MLVRCSKCKNYDFFHGHFRSDAVRKARAAGWIYDYEKEKGHLCPECRKKEEQMSTTTEKEKPSPFTVEHPEYPKLLYNAKARTTAAATDKEHEEKLAAKGFGEDPYPPLPPDVMTDQDMLQLESLLHKMLNEISKYNKLHLNSSSASAADDDNMRAPARTDRPASRPPAR